MNKVSWTCVPGYTGENWNVVRGCARPCLVDCWARKQAIRSEFRKVGENRVPGPYYGLVEHTSSGPKWSGRQQLVESLLPVPAHWRKRRCIATSLMGDLYGGAITNEQIATVYGVASVCREHRFVMLTKQSERRARWYDWAELYAPDDGGTGPLRALSEGLCTSSAAFPESWDREEGPPLSNAWPLTNVIELASCHDQNSFDRQMAALRSTPAAFRGLSVEPLLRPIDMTDSIGLLDWVIVGADSNGHRAEALSLEAVQSVVDQCTAARVAVFVKGIHLPNLSLAGFRYSANPAEGWPAILKRREWPERFFYA